MPSNLHKVGLLNNQFAFAFLVFLKRKSERCGRCDVLLRKESYLFGFRNDCQEFVADTGCHTVHTRRLVAFNRVR